MPEPKTETHSRIIRILHLEDDPDDALIFASILSVLDPVGYVVTSVKSIDQARQAMTRESFDIVIADYKLDQTEASQSSSPLLLEVLEHSSYLPVLLTSGQEHIPFDPELQEYLDGGRIRFVSKDVLSTKRLETEILQQLKNFYAVLVIDDDPDDRTFIADILTSSHQRNFDLRFASTLEEAKASVAARAFDIIICDWHLGAERSAGFIIETADAYPDTCIIFLTGVEIVDLPVDVYRMFGRRRIAFHSKQILRPETFESFLISHMNRLVGTVVSGQSGENTAPVNTAPPNHPEEVARQQALDDLQQVYLPAERRFDVITEAARKTFDVPIVLISFVHEDKQWFKSAQGIAAAETDRCISFCGHAILQTEIYEIEDASVHPLFKDNPLVTGPPGIRFYVGMPVRSDMGLPLGTLCLIDTRPRKLNSLDRRRLHSLGHWVETEMQNRGLHADVLARIVAKFGHSTKNLLDAETKVWGMAAGELLLAGLLERAHVAGKPATVGVLQLRTKPADWTVKLRPEQKALLRLEFANAVRAAFGEQVIFFAQPPGYIFFINDKPGRLESLADLGAMGRQLSAHLSKQGRAESASIHGVVCHKENADGRQKKNIIDRLLREVEKSTQPEWQELASW